MPLCLLCPGQLPPPHYAIGVHVHYMRRSDWLAVVAVNKQILGRLCHLNVDPIPEQFCTFVYCS